MTFSVSRDGGLFEWAGTNLMTLFAQPSNLFKLSMWRMIFDIFRFNQYALDSLMNAPDSTEGVSESNAASEETIGAYLKRGGYSDAFRDDYLIPMTAAVWSTSPDKCSLEFPAVTLVRFLWNHHLLTTIGSRPQWLTLSLGSKSYIDAALKHFPADRIHLNTAVTQLKFREDGTIHLTTCPESGTPNSGLFDKVIFACHAPVTKMITAFSAGPAEKEILGAFKTSSSTAVLHNDTSLLPKRRRAWTSWNYLTVTKSKNPTGRPRSASWRRNIDNVCLTYNMNILQHIPRGVFGDVLVTLNPLHPPQGVQAEFAYEHPLYTVAAMEAQRRLPEVQGRRGVYYAGAWTKYGFHEDGFTSGLEAALKLGADIPFEFVDSRYSRGRKPVLGAMDYLCRAWIVAMLWLFRVIGWVLAVLGVGKGELKVKKVKYTNGNSMPSWARAGSEDEGLNKRRKVSHDFTAAQD